MAFLKILGVMLDSKITFEHICSILLSVVQKIGLRGKSFRIFEEQNLTEML